ncbi:apolipoprotein L6 isoform 2-T3 [Molossus nigricans]
MSMDLEVLKLLAAQSGDDDDILLGEDVEQQDIDLSIDKEIFLKEFPSYKRELEVAIKKHRDLADDLDKTKKNFTKASLVTSSIAVTSGAMTILGLALAPATAGGSLILSAAGKGLGTLAGASVILSNILECAHNKKAQAKVGSQGPTLDQKVKDNVEKASCVLTTAGKTALACTRAVKDIKNDIRAFKIARAHPRLAAAAKRLLTTGQVSARRSRQVQKVFGGTSLAMRSSTRLVSGVMSGLFLGLDLKSLQNDYKQLKEGVRSEYAEGLRAKADELERILTELTQLYERLQQEVTLGYSASARHGEAGPQATAAGQDPPLFAHKRMSLEPAGPDSIRKERGPVVPKTQSSSGISWLLNSSAFNVCLAFLVLAALLKVMNWY